MSRKLAAISVLGIAAAIAVVYFPSLKIGYYDGWWFLEWSATMDLPRYLVQFIDPANITQGYRPVQGLYIYLLYHLFGFNPDPFHLAHILLHVANSTLLFLIVWRLGKQWRLALIAALVYATMPVYCLAVFWHATADPLVGLFYLTTILFWIKYLEGGHRRDWVITLGAYVLALLSKEVAFFLPFLMFLIEWWFINGKPSLFMVRRYAPFVLVLLPYLWMVWQVQSRGTFTHQFEFRIGPQMVVHLVPYLAALAFPWTTEMPTQAIYYIWLAVVTLLYLTVTLYKRSATLLFLAIVTIVNISPVTGFPIEYYDSRYLYLSAIGPAIVLAILMEELGQRIGARKAYVSIALAGIVGLLLFTSGWRVTEEASALAEYTRQVRVPFHDISQQHPTFPDHALLYFLYPTTTSLADFKGLFLVRYGQGLTVSGTDDYGYPALRNYESVFVYYFDETNSPRELVMDQSITTRASLPLPADFDVPVRLDRYDVINPVVTRGDPLVLLLHWQPRAVMDKDYTIFAHLVDLEGRVRAQYDSQPRRGTSPTSQWKLPHSVADAILLSIASEVPPGIYRLELGLYDQATMQRFAVVDARGQPVADKIVIKSIEIR